jgi:hypothetical protein
MILEEDRLILHDLRGVNLRVDFFLGTRKDLASRSKCIAYSVCWDLVDVRVDEITMSEHISDLDFCFGTQKLVIDDHVISGEVFGFHCERGEGGVLTAFCKILLGKEY